MLNFASLFNQFRSQSNSGLNDLLQQSNVKMGRLLDEESFTNEYKSGNSRVAEFMKYEKFVQLIEFVTVVGPSQDKKRSYKYPLSACDLLSIDNANTIDHFFPEKPLTIDQKVFQEVQVEIQEEVELTPEEIQALGPQIQQIQTPVVAQKVQSEPKIQKNDEESEKSQNQDSSSNQEEGKEKKIQEQPPKQKVQVESVPAKKHTKKVLRQQKKSVERIIKKQAEPLLNRLLSYFDSQINYTLAGYVSKILSFFFNKKPSEIYKTLLDQNVALKIIDHAESRSVGDLIVKLLINETTLSLQKRRDFFKLILNRLSINSQVHILSNLSAYVCQVIEKIAANLKGNNKIVQFNQIFFSLDVITQVIKNVISDQQNVSIYNAPILFTYLTSVPFILPQEQIVIDQFKNLLQHFIDKGLQKLEVNNRNRPKIGSGRMKIIQILRFILKQNILSTKDIVGGKQNFFKILINLIREYPLNNLLHNEIIKIFDIALGQPEGSLLNNSILKDNILLNFVSEEVAQDKNIKAGASVYKYRKGYIAHIINLCLRLKQFAVTNSTLKKEIESGSFGNIYEDFIDKQVFNSKKSLAGFSMRKDIKHEIMFQKQDIIANYITFLKNCPASVFQNEPEHVNIQHPDLVEQLQKQLEQNLTIKQKEQQRVQQEQETKAVQVQAQVIIPGFIYHLQYSGDDLTNLMNDL